MYLVIANIGSTDRFYRGKVLGGSSTINGAVNTRGNPNNYNNWAKLGNTGWSYEKCLPYFKKIESADFSAEKDTEFRGYDGPVHVNVPEDTPVLV